MVGKERIGRSRTIPEKRSLIRPTILRKTDATFRARGTGIVVIFKCLCLAAITIQKRKVRKAKTIIAENCSNSLENNSDNK